MNRKNTAPHHGAPARVTHRHDDVRVTRYLHDTQPFHRTALSRNASRSLLLMLAAAGALSIAPRVQASTKNVPASTRTAAKSPRITVVETASAKTLVSGVRLAQEQTNTPAAAPDEPEKEPSPIITVDPDKTTAPAEPAPPADTTTETPATPAVPVTPAAPGDTVIAPGGETATPDTTTPDTTAPPVVGSAAEAEGRAIAQVRVVGNRVVAEQTILLQATGTRAGAAYSSRQADLDRSKIDALGFFASVQQQVTPNLEDPTKVDVTFIVVENRITSGFRFEGNVNLKTEDLRKVLDTKVGSVLNRNTVNSDVEKVQNLYRERGFVVLVGQTRQTEDGTLVFSLQEARIARIEISGQKKTRPSLIRRQIRSKTGDVFDQVQIRKDLNRIYDMGFFEDVSYKVADDPDKPAQAVVTYVVKEKRTGQLSLGAGFDNRSRITGFASVVESNFHGTGKSISGSIELGGRRTFEVGFADPFVGNKNAGYDVSLFQRNIFRSPRSVEIVTGGGNTTDKTLNYEERRTGLRANYTQPLDDDRTRNLLFGVRNESARLFQTGDNGKLTPISLPENSSGRVFAPSIGFLRDKRDLRLDPSRGGREQIIIEQGISALGGTTSFTKLDLDLRRYFPLMKASKAGEQPRLVLANRFVYGRSFGNLPAFEQYFIGGPDTVRGYDNDELYGDNQFYNNLELRLRLNKSFQIVGFTDIGRAFGGRFSSVDERTLFSVGAGIRLKTPIGPIRLDVGRGDSGIKTHFAIGPTF